MGVKRSVLTTVAMAGAAVGLFALGGCGSMQSAFGTDEPATPQAEAQPAQISAADNLDLYQRAMPGEQQPQNYDVASAQPQNPYAQPGAQNSGQPLVTGSVPPPADGATDDGSAPDIQGNSRNAYSAPQVAPTPVPQNPGAQIPPVQQANGAPPNGNGNALKQPYPGAPQGAEPNAGQPALRNAAYVQPSPPAPQQQEQEDPEEKELAANSAATVRDSIWDWAKIDQGRHTREVTPAQRLRESRKALRDNQVATPSGAVSGGSYAAGGTTTYANGITEGSGLGLRGAQGSVPPKVLSAQDADSSQTPPQKANLQPAQNAAAAKPGRKASPEVTGSIPSATPSRERPMRIYFSPGVSSLSSQLISSVSSVARSQQAARRPVHVIGVAAAPGGEGAERTDPSSLNQLALDRAKAVARELTANGVAQKDIVIHAQQEHRTADGGSAIGARSRRVDIYID